MKNLILKQGDLVKVTGPIDTYGGQVPSGEVHAVDLRHGALVLSTQLGDVTLVNADGTLTDACDCVRVLPGQGLPSGVSKVSDQRQGASWN